MSVTKPSRRLIDAMPTPPIQKEMKVLVLGLCRTGTTSIRTALGQLGINSCGYKEVAVAGHCKYWSEAIDAKFNRSGKTPYGPVEFRKLLADYGGVTDIPMVLFVDELRVAFPDARIVVSNREIDSWIVSMQKVVLEIMSWKSTWLLAPFDRQGLGSGFLGIWKCLEVMTEGDVFGEKALRKGFKDHYAYVRRVVPARKRLEYRVQDGWGPLCDWLGLDEPKGVTFPNINDGQATVKELAVAWRVLLGIAVTKISVYGGVVGAIVWAVWAKKVPFASKWLA